MDIYATYLSRIRSLLQGLEHIHKYDTVRYRISDYETEINLMIASLARKIDDHMAKDFNSRKNKDRSNELPANRSRN